MLLNFTVLFAVTLIAGLLVYIIPKWEGENYNLTLIFAGAYLFGITIIHILPELYGHNGSRELIGAMILAGFFFQIFLEYFTSGVEHGHVHTHDHGSGHTMVTSVSMLVALCIHAFMEGSLLAHPSDLHEHHQSNALLVGILLHKIPAAFALMSIVTCHFDSKPRQIMFLIVFALASPVGLLVSDEIAHNNLISENGFVIIFALVSGSFLKISTTIFFESSPEHRLSLKKIIISLFAAGLAIVAENLF